MRINFSDRQQFERLEDMAIDGHLDYSDFPPEEYTYFSKLARLGYLNRHKGLDYDICIAQQKELHEDYTRHCERRDEQLKFSKRLLKMRIKATELLRQLNTARDPEQALRLACRYIETIRNEDSGLEKRVLTNTGKEKLKCNFLAD